LALGTAFLSQPVEVDAQGPDHGRSGHQGHGAPRTPGYGMGSAGTVVRGKNQGRHQPTVTSFPVVDSGPLASGAAFSLQFPFPGTSFSIYAPHGKPTDPVVDILKGRLALLHNWAHGSVIRGWSVELMERSLREHNLKELSGHVEDPREVRWAVAYALEKEAWVPVIAQSELAPSRYRDPGSVAGTRCTRSRRRG